MRIDCRARRKKVEDERPSQFVVTLDVNTAIGCDSPDAHLRSVLPADQELGERIHIVVMRPSRKDCELMQKIIHSRAFREKLSVGPWVREIHVAGFDEGLHCIGTRLFATLRGNSDQARDF